jgi:glycosyltransferase involved in cell wall biosynthesis
MKKRKILFVVNRFHPEVGGAETNTYFQAKLLAKDHSVTVFTPKRDNYPDDEVVDGIKIKRAKDYFNRNNYYPNLRGNTLCLGLIKEILFGDYDVVQCFPAINYNVMIARMCTWIRLIPCILCCFDFLNYAQILKLQGDIKADILEQTKLSPWRKFFLRRFDYIFSISDKEMAYMKKYNERVEFSPVPVLLEEFEKEVEDPRSRYGVKPDEFVFLVLGRVSQLKGQDIAVHAFKKYCEQNDNGKMVVVGRNDYSPQMTTELTQYCHANNIADRVIFTGGVSRDEVLGWLKNCNIHVIPVRFMNSGAVVVETWASHRPVIQSDVVDPNLVVEGENGFLFKSRDVESLANKMQVSYEHRDEFNRMAKNGRKLVENKFNYNYLINLYEKAYQTII